MKYSSITMLALLLSACTATYTETLEQKLADKTPQQKRAILAQECSQQISTSEKPDTPERRKHFERMREICGDMTGKSIPVSPVAMAKP